MTQLRTHILAALSLGVAYETKQAQQAKNPSEQLERAKRAQHLRAALYRVSQHKFTH